MKKVLYPIVVLLLCSAGYAFAFDQNLSAREETNMEKQIRELTAAVQDMRAEMNGRARLRSQEQDRADAGRPCYGRGRHSYDGCRRYRHHF